MTTTLEGLETRLSALEEEVTHLRTLVSPGPRADSATQRGARALTQARQDKSRLKALAAQVFSQMGITQAPVPPEQLRTMMAADGVKAEANLFTQEIREMREE